MPKALIDQMRDRLAGMEILCRTYDRQLAAKGGRISRSDSWNYEYLRNPYLLGSTDERLAERFRHIFINQTELGQDAKVGMLPFDENNAFIAKFAHLTQEFNARGGTPVDVIAAAREPVLKYFEKGDPIAVQIFASYVPPANPILVKYGERQFLEPMLRDGRVRICPASYYDLGLQLARLRPRRVSLASVAAARRSGRRRARTER